jgi:hypothetical protein
VHIFFALDTPECRYRWYTTPKVQETYPLEFGKELPRPEDTQSDDEGLKNAKEVSLAHNKYDSITSDVQHPLKSRLTRMRASHTGS